MSASVICPPKRYGWWPDWPRCASRRSSDAKSGYTWSSYASWVDAKPIRNVKDEQ